MAEIVRIRLVFRQASKTQIFINKITHNERQIKGGRGENNHPEPEYAEVRGNGDEE